MEALRGSSVCGFSLPREKQPPILERAALRVEALSRKCGSMAAPLVSKLQESRISPGLQDRLRSRLEACLKEQEHAWWKRRKSSLTKRYVYGRIVARVLGRLFWGGKKRQHPAAAERRRKVYAALLSLGVRLLILSQAEKLSMLRALYKDSSDFTGFSGGSGSGSGGGGGGFGGFSGNDDDSDEAPRRRNHEFLLRLSCICGAIVAAAVGFVFLTNPAYMTSLCYSWLLDWIMSLAVVLSFAILSFWMFKMAALAILHICRSSYWIFEEIGSWLRENVNFSWVMVACAMAMAMGNSDWTHRCCLAANTMVVNVKYRLRNLKYRLRQRKSRLSNVLGKARSVFTRR